MLRIMRQNHFSLRTSSINQVSPVIALSSLMGVLSVSQRLDIHLITLFWETPSFFPESLFLRDGFSCIRDCGQYVQYVWY